MKPFLILDVDGVIFDSNNLKEENIKKAALKYVNEAIADDFVSYFTSLNGVPREIKINNYFKGDKVCSEILGHYNQLNSESLRQVDFTKNAFRTLKELSKNYELIALSGGDESELKMLFNLKKIDSYFLHIFGAPNTKHENLKQIDVNNVVCFVGDSKVDFEVANEFDLSFVFMKTYSQFSNWKYFFDKYSAVPIINYIDQLSKIIKQINRND